MGLQSWRGLSVLLLAGVALVGCNNTPDKPKSFSGNGPTTLPGNLASQGQGPTQLMQSQNRFPTANPGNPTAPNAFPGSIQGNGAANTGGLPGSFQGNGAANTSFTPAPGTGGQLPTFPPLPKDPSTSTNRSDIMPYPNVPSNSGFAADPLRSPPLPGGVTPPQRPQGFPQ